MQTEAQHFFIAQMMHFNKFAPEMQPTHTGCCIKIYEKPKKWVEKQRKEKRSNFAKCTFLMEMLTQLSRNESAPKTLKIMKH
jgi:hypothetical protein